jgi:hypothetical protein
MAAHAVRYEPTPDNPDELANRVHGERTIEDLQEAQKRRLKALPPPVHPLVWEVALAAAGGDVRRIAVFSPTEVHVMNNPDQKPGWLVDESYLEDDVPIQGT